jgi:hypothetical protein
MVSQGSLATEVRPQSIEALKILAGYGRARKVTVAIENRDTGAAPAPPAPPPTQPAPPAADPAAGRGRGGGGGGGRGGPPPPPATWQVVMEVIKAAGIAATPNMANFPNDTERAAGLRALFPLSGGTCHCGSDATYSLADAVKISKEAGYQGLYSLNAGGGADPHAAITAALDVLVKSS